MLKSESTKVDVTLTAQLGVFVSDLRETFGWQLPSLLALMVLVALGEGLSMALLLPLLSAIGLDGMSGNGPQASISRLMHLVGDQLSVYEILVLVIVVLLIQGLLCLWQVWWVANFQRRYGAKWQRHLFAAFMHARWTFFSGHKQGQLVNAITNETARLAGALYVLLQLVSTLVVALVYLLIAAVLSWLATLALIAFGLILFLGVRGIRAKNHRIGITLGPLNAELNVLLNEFLGGVKLIKATATEGKAIRQVACAVESLREHHTWGTFLPGLVRALFEFLSIAALCMVLVFGHRILEIPAAQLLVVLALFVRLLPRFNALQQNLQLLATYVPALNCLNDLLHEADRQREPVPEVPGIIAAEGASLHIDIRRAGYVGIDVLKNLRIDLPARGFVGLVGESGAGKSTLVHCLLGLCEISEGEVRMGDLSMNAIALTDWRRAIGYVPQETILFHLTVRENIAWAMDDAQGDEVHEAARRAHAETFIESLSQGYDTVIGDQGMRLSGGQRQRLGIARALINRPKVLLLDEATSALDSASEQAVLQTVEGLKKEICIVSVAHRLSSVRGADLILVMKDGTVVESGTWEELMGRDSSLRALSSAQQLG
ncbi:MAG: ABC transporter ATP-binding protein [Sulfuricella sp.]|jgi:ATP-binding cassette subfamily C protein